MEGPGDRHLADWDDQLQTLTRDGAIIFGDLNGKLLYLGKCGRAGCYHVQHLIDGPPDLPRVL
jgi:hypothetical protein